jgi:hypothetical protein
VNGYEHPWCRHPRGRRRDDPRRSYPGHHRGDGQWGSWQRREPKDGHPGAVDRRHGQGGQRARGGLGSQRRPDGPKGIGAIGPRGGEPDFSHGGGKADGDSGGAAGPRPRENGPGEGSRLSPLAGGGGNPAETTPGAIRNRATDRNCPGSSNPGGNPKEGPGDGVGGQSNRWPGPPGSLRGATKDQGANREHPEGGPN